MSLRYVLFGAVLALGCLPLAKAAHADDLRDGFHTPPKSARPTARWWWPGGDVENAELRREIAQMDQAGFGSVEIQAFGVGLRGPFSPDRQSRIDDFATDRFYRHVGAALDEARHLGLTIDFTFGSGWPFGGRATTPEQSSLELAYRTLAVTGPAAFHDRVPLPGAAELAADPKLPTGWSKRLEARERIIAVLALRQSAPSTAKDAPISLDPASTVILTDRVASDGTLDWAVPDGIWQIFVFEEHPTGQRVVGGVGGGAQLVLDHFDRTAFEAHADAIGAAATRNVGGFYGSTFQALFCDSLEVAADIYWGHGLIERFREQHGYDLTPYLPALIVAVGDNDALLQPYVLGSSGRQVLHDYFETLSGAIIANFYQPFIDWSHQHGLKARIQAHGAPADLIRLYGLADIPESENLYASDSIDFFKLASSAGDGYGRPVVSNESFAWREEPYGVTPERLKRAIDRMLTAGLNRIIYHGVPYRYADRPAPGWTPFSAPEPFTTFLNAENPFWPDLTVLNGYLTRLQFIFQQTRTLAPVVIYRDVLQYPFGTATAEPALNQALDQAGYGFDLVNLDLLRKSRVENGRLVMPSGQSHDVLILQDQSAIPVALADRLKQFVNAGLPVIFVGETPTQSASLADVAAKTSEIADDMQAILAPGTTASLVPSVSDAISKIGQRRPSPLAFAGPPLPFIEKQAGRDTFVFFHNPADAPQTLDVAVEAAGPGELWDPWTGAVHPIGTIDTGDGHHRVHLDLPAGGSVLLRFGPEVAAQAMAERVGTSTPLADLAWHLRVRGLGPDGREKLVERSLPSLTNWADQADLRHISGRGTYSTDLTLPPAMADAASVVLDLGEVHDVAELRINGHPGPTILMPPYRADVTKLLRPGRNHLEITVVNSLANAMASREAARAAPGKAALGAAPAGLIGPVSLVEIPHHD